MLKDLSFPTTIDTSSADLLADFFIPSLKNSIRYDRGVGFFSSGWLRIAAAGMVEFARNGGRARWVTSPILSEADWEALQVGDEARHDPLLREVLARNVDDLADMLERETLSALAWMVADGILSFKLAVPHNRLEGGDFHDKFGIFTDTAGDQVSFNGSYNESIKGTRNYESLKIFRSWEPAFTGLVDSDVQRFEMLWNNQDPNVRVFELPEAAKQHIVRLRSDERPYPTPEWILERQLHDTGPEYLLAIPFLPEGIALRDYQEEAIDAWFKHDCQGLLEMATGTGKTITALAASARLYSRESSLAVIIAVPYQHLVDQWHEEADAFGYRPVLAYQSKASWLDELNHQIIDFNGGYRPFISVITTHATFISPAFQDSIARLRKPALIIADEAHHVGAEQSRENYPQNVRFRLALSATPDRWFDDVGTHALRDYFGETVFTFSLADAIGVSLTPYYYYPHLVSLTVEEFEKYEVLSAKIAKLINHEDVDSQEALKMLLIKRANLLNTAENKLPMLADLVDYEESLQHALFYCAPGQIDDVLSLLGWQKSLLVHRFTAEEDPEKRQELLADFASGDLQALAAMKCLDEGVDVPSTRIAYFLASSSNPREFIQRRGRILRKAPGKDHAIVHDLISVPPTMVPLDSPSFSAERSIVRKELQRFKEFSNTAMNKYEALDVIWEIASHYGLLDF